MQRPTLGAYRLSGEPRTLILDFPSVREQARVFGRIVLFIERLGAPRTRVMTQAEVISFLNEAGLTLDTLTVGNNFRASELAEFFNAASRQNEPLGDDERWLRSWLLSIDALQRDGGRLTARTPEIVLLSIPQVSSVAHCRACDVSAAARAAILEHELAHARFATDQDYRNRVLRFWTNEMDNPLRQRFTAFLESRGYDSGNPTLMANEMQAFLLHTPMASMFSASAVGLSDAALDNLRCRLLEAGAQAVAGDGRRDDCR